MAQLPPDGGWLVQQIEDKVVVFNRHSEDEIVSYGVNDFNATAQAQKIIHDSDMLGPEAKCFAHFWCGYFYAHATHTDDM